MSDLVISHRVVVSVVVMDDPPGTAAAVMCQDCSEFGTGFCFAFADFPLDGPDGDAVANANDQAAAHVLETAAAWQSLGD